MMVISPNRFWGILLATIKGVKPAGWIRGVDSPGNGAERRKLSMAEECWATGAE